MNNDNDIEKNKTSCDITLSHDDRIKLLQAGYHLKDENHLGLNIPSKLHYVYPDKIYARHFEESEGIWRIVYLGQPALLKDYVGKSATCGIAYGYSVSSNDSSLKPVRLASIQFLEESQHPS